MNESSTPSSEDVYRDCAEHITNGLTIESLVANPYKKYMGYKELTVYTQKPMDFCNWYDVEAVDARIDAVEQYYANLVAYRNLLTATGNDLLSYELALRKNVRIGLTKFLFDYYGVEKLPDMIKNNIISNAEFDSIKVLQLKLEKANVKTTI